jgi:hypothetical protein
MSIKPTATQIAEYAKLQRAVDDMLGDYLIDLMTAKNAVGFLGDRLLFWKNVRDTDDIQRIIDSMLDDCIVELIAAKNLEIDRSVDRSIECSTDTPSTDTPKSAQNNLIQETLLLLLAQRRIAMHRYSAAESPATESPAAVDAEQVSHETARDNPDLCVKIQQLVYDAMRAPGSGSSGNTYLRTQQAEQTARQIMALWADLWEELCRKLEETKSRCERLRADRSELTKTLHATSKVMMKLNNVVESEISNLDRRIKEDLQNHGPTSFLSHLQD